jgi:hypothetical protein
VALAGTLATLVPTHVSAAGLLYVAGSVGPTRVSYDASTFAAGSSSTGYEIAAGTQPLPVLAGEVDYLGFPRAFSGINFADTYGYGINALGFLPLPVVQVFGKIGLLRWHTHAHSSLLTFSRNGVNLDYGGGIGMHWGSLGARIQYERFEIAHTRQMQLTSIGLTWNLL